MTLDINISKHRQLGLVQGINQRKQPDNLPHSEIFKNMFSCKLQHQVAIDAIISPLPKISAGWGHDLDKYIFY